MAPTPLVESAKKVVSSKYACRLCRVSFDLRGARAAASPSSCCDARSQGRRTRSVPLALRRYSRLRMYNSISLMMIPLERPRQRSSDVRPRPPLEGHVLICSLRFSISSCDDRSVVLCLCSVPRRASLRGHLALPPESGYHRKQPHSTWRTWTLPNCPHSAETPCSRHGIGSFRCRSSRTPVPGCRIGTT